MPTSNSDLQNSLEKHNEVFESLLKLIPPKYYLVHEDAEAQYASKYQKNSKKQKAPKQAIKEASKKAKKDKFDPENNKTILDIQKEALAARSEKQHSPKSKGKRKAAVLEEDGSDVDSDTIHLDAPMSDKDDDRMNEYEGNAEEDAPVPMPKSGGIAELREKLHARIAQLRNRGKGRSTQGGEPSSRDELMEERRQQRAAMRERRRKETKEKIRQQEERKGKGQDKGKEKQQQQQQKGHQTKTQLLVPDSAYQDPESKLTSVAFSNLNVPSSSSKPPKHKKNMPTTTSNPAQALSQLEKHKEKLAALPEAERIARAERDKWDKASARVDGVKVLDDESRLKKAVKRKEKQKSKSKQSWDERKEQLSKSMAARQQKRSDNIAARAERRKGGGKGKGKDKARPGFEGKSFGKGKGKAKAKK